MDLDKVKEKEYSWSQEVKNENITSNKETDVIKPPYYETSRTTRKKEASQVPTKLINLKTPKIRPQPNLSASLRRRMKTNLRDNEMIKSRKNTEEEIKMTLLVEETKKLRSLLEEYKKNQRRI